MPRCLLFMSRSQWKVLFRLEAKAQEACINRIYPNTTTCSTRICRVCTEYLNSLMRLGMLTASAFYLKPSNDGVRHNATVLLSHHGSEAVPEYSLRHPDPSLPASKNKYAVALYDIYNPEILFGEILLIPQWTQPSLSQEEIRANKGVPPAPQPILPTEFIIQLYNPDQQVVLRSLPGSWNSAPYWEFEMPQRSFRQPSNSTLDRTQSDPTAVETTPKSIFKWKKDGKLSKDYVCSFAGKSTSLQSAKRKHKEPDITVALFRHLREITIYEPNLSRVEIEDFKGLEVVLLLGAVVLREVFSGQLKDAFNIVDLPSRDSNDNDPRKTSNVMPAVFSSSDSASYSAESVSQSSSARNQNLPLRIQTPKSSLPPTDPRSQWAIDLETARLKKQVEHEERERRRLEQAETKRVKKMVEAEEREARAKQAEIDKETKRLKSLYAVEQRLAPASKLSHPPSRQDRPRQTSTPLPSASLPKPRSAATGSTTHSPNPTSRRSSGPYHLTPKNLSSSGFSGGSHSPQDEANRVKAKRSFFGLRSLSDQQPRRLAKKQSAVW